MKSLLLRDVAYLCRRADRLWSEPIVHTLRDIRESKLRAVFFGGTLRSLLMARIKRGRLGRPRDVDIVVEGDCSDGLRKRFRDIIARETRFGGFHLQRMNWEFDVWPLQRTWAFLQDRSLSPSFAALPFTTFFNLEAIAVDVWARPGSPRNIYCGDDQFFEGIMSRTVEVNREENPFPELCVVRALIMASSLDFAIGPRLARYLAAHASRISNAELEETQRSHYGRLYQGARTLREWIQYVQDSVGRRAGEPVKLPAIRQQMLWPEEPEDPPSLRIRVL